jgi:hypothetical protein
MIIINQEELDNLVAMRNTGDKYGKTYWWKNIRDKYDLPDEKLKIDLDTGVVKFKNTNSLVESTVKAAETSAESSTVKAAAAPYHLNIPDDPSSEVDKNADVDLKAYGFIDSDDGTIIAYTGHGALQAIFDREDRPKDEVVYTILVCSTPDNL